MHIEGYSKGDKKLKTAGTQRERTHGTEKMSKTLHFTCCENFVFVTCYNLLLLVL